MPDRDAEPIAQPRWPAWIIVLIVAVTFGRLVTADFTLWDDPYTVWKNPAMLPPTRHGVMEYWRLIQHETAQQPRVINHQFGLWVPLTYTVWGGLASVAQVGDGVTSPREVNPYVFHAFSVILQCAAGLLALNLLRRLRFSGRAVTIGALIFAVHPMQVETVAWVSGLKDLLAGVLSLTALLLYVVHADAAIAPGRRRALWWAATLCCGLAMLSKPSAVVVPLLAVMIDLLLLGRPLKQILLATIPWFAMALKVAVIARLSQPALGVDAVALWQRPLVAADALGFYLLQFLAPIKLGIDYGRTPAAIVESGAIWCMWLIPATLGSACVIAAMRGERRPLAGFLMFVIALLPVLGFIPFLYQYYSTTADHYAYVAVLGLVVIVATFIDRIPRRLVFPAAVALVAVLAGRSFVQCAVWYDSQSLFSHAINVHPRSYVARTNLGSVYSRTGDYASAQRLFTEAIAIDPRNQQAVRNLREILTVTEEPQEAMALFKKEMRIVMSLPNDITADFWNDASAFGALLLARGHTAEAEVELSRVVEADQSNLNAQKLLALARLVERPASSTAPATLAAAPLDHRGDRIAARPNDREQPAER